MIGEGSAHEWSRAHDDWGDSPAWREAWTNFASRDSTDRKSPDELDTYVAKHALDASPAESVRDWHAEAARHSRAIPLGYVQIGGLERAVTGDQVRDGDLGHVVIAEPESGEPLL